MLVRTMGRTVNGCMDRCSKESMIVSNGDAVAVNVLLLRNRQRFLHRLHGVAARQTESQQSMVWLLDSCCSRSAASLSHRPPSPLPLQQLLKMRDDLKQRELELEKSLEDKLQLKSQVQNLKEDLQKLQSSHAMQVSFAG